MTKLDSWNAVNIKYSTENYNSLVIFVLCSKSEGGWFDLSWCH